MERSRRAVIMIWVVLFGFFVTAPVFAAGGPEKVRAKTHTKYCMKNGSVIITPLVHDGGEGIEIAEVKKPFAGRADLLMSQAIRYTPKTGYTGFDRFAYVIRDARGNRSTGTISIRIWDKPWPTKPPQAGSIKVTAAKNGEAVINVLKAVTDFEEGHLVITATGEPKQGTVSILGNNRLLYRPASETTGTDSFTFTVTRVNAPASVLAADSATGQVTVTVQDGSGCIAGNGNGCTAAEREGIQYGGDLGCSRGTIVTLNGETGSPANQQVCGIETSDSTGTDLFLYKGIQYADSPAGNKRWTDPTPPQWNTLRAVEYGPTCPQGNPSAAGNPAIDEDCLYLNVWTPKVTPDGSGTLPVMVFIHGGAFISGSGGSAKGDTTNHLNIYDGSQFVATSRNGENIVFVTLNYRLGVLGFLAGDKFGLNGNFGIKDQTKALQWVQRNIALFGGDPTRVMIFGESAGAQSTALHLTITDDNHQSLFEKGVLESNYAITYMTVKEAQAKADKFAGDMGCQEGTTDEILACLRNPDISSVPWILQNQTKGAYTTENIACAGLQAIIPWNPVIDGTFITMDPIQARIAKPMMNGSNLNESVPFIGLLPDNDLESGTAYIALTDFLFGTDWAKIMRDEYFAQYPFKSEKDRFEQVVTDYLWTCFNRKLSSITSADSYRYHYIHHSSFPVWVNSDGQATSGIPADCAQSGIVCHADELPYVFGNATDTQMIRQTFTADEAGMSLALRNYWIQFARSSQPVVTGQTSWPLNTSGNILQIQAPGSAIIPVTDKSIADPANCGPLWDHIGYIVTSTFTCK